MTVPRIVNDAVHVFEKQRGAQEGEKLRAALAPYLARRRLPPAAHLTREQTATVLAALRYYQQQGLGDCAKRPKDIDEIATDAGDLVSLDDAGIDELCVLLNGV